MQVQFTRQPSSLHLMCHIELSLDPIQNTDDLLFHYNQDPSYCMIPYATKYREYSLKTYLNLQQSVCNDASNVTLSLFLSRLHRKPSAPCLQCIFHCGLKTLMRRSYTDIITALMYRDDTLVHYCRPYDEPANLMLSIPFKQEMNVPMRPSDTSVASSSFLRPLQQCPTQDHVFSQNLYMCTALTSFDDSCCYALMALRPRYDIVSLNAFRKYISKILPVCNSRWPMIVGTRHQVTTKNTNVQTLTVKRCLPGVASASLRSLSTLKQEFWEFHRNNSSSDNAPPNSSRTTEIVRSHTDYHDMQLMNKQAHFSIISPRTPENLPEQKSISTTLHTSNKILMTTTKASAAPNTPSLSASTGLKRGAADHFHIEQGAKKLVKHPHIDSNCIGPLYNESTNCLCGVPNANEASILLLHTSSNLRKRPLLSEDQQKVDTVTQEGEFSVNGKLQLATNNVKYYTPDLCILNDMEVHDIDITSYLTTTTSEDPGIVSIVGRMMTDDEYEPSKEKLIGPDPLTASIDNAQGDTEEIRVDKDAIPAAQIKEIGPNANLLQETPMLSTQEHCHRALPKEKDQFVVVGDWTMHLGDQIEKLNPSSENAILSYNSKRKSSHNASNINTSIAVFDKKRLNFGIKRLRSTSPYRNTSKESRNPSIIPSSLTCIPLSSERTHSRLSIYNSYWQYSKYAIKRACRSSSNPRLQAPVSSRENMGRPYIKSAKKDKGALANEQKAGKMAMKHYKKPNFQKDSDLVADVQVVNVFK